MKKLNHSSQAGQGIVEYILITAFVALAAIGMFKAFNSQIQEAYNKAGQVLIQGVDDSLSADPLPSE